MLETQGPCMNAMQTDGGPAYCTDTCEYCLLAKAAELLRLATLDVVVNPEQELRDRKRLALVEYTEAGAVLCSFMRGTFGGVEDPDVSSEQRVAYRLGVQSKE